MCENEKIAPTFSYALPPSLPRFIEYLTSLRTFLSSKWVGSLHSLNCLWTLLYPCHVAWTRPDVPLHTFLLLFWSGEEGGREGGRGGLSLYVSRSLPAHRLPAPLPSLPPSLPAVIAFLKLVSWAHTNWDLRQVSPSFPPSLPPFI